MSDDIETLRAFLRIAVAPVSAHPSANSNAVAAFDRIAAERDRLQGRVATLEKASVDRHAADRKAWKAIMEKAGRDRGVPPDKEVVAFYVAEVERLEKECDHLSTEGLKNLRDYSVYNDSLRAKLDRATAKITECAQFMKSYQRSNVNWHNDGPTRNFIKGNLEPFLSELSDDAPAQQTQRDIRTMSDGDLALYLACLEKRWDDLMASLEESGGCSGSPGEWPAEEMNAARAEQKRRAQQTQISDEAREAMAQAKDALSSLLDCPEISDADPRDKDDETHTAERKARAAIAKLRSVMK